MRLNRNLGMSAALLALAAAPAFAQSQTAQSAMVQVTPTNTAYEVVETVTWTFQRGTHNEPGTAMLAYTNLLTSGPTFVSCGGNASACGAANAPAPATIAAATPAPDDVKLQQAAQAERCTFFLGGTLSGPATYTQEATVNGANGNGNWKYKWTYTIAPINATVAAQTAWTSEETGGTVDVGFEGFVASESFLKQSSRNKYSFTMIDGGVTRARNVTATLQQSDGLGGWADIGTPVDLNNVDTDGDTVADGLAIVPASSNFSYFGNVGVFGNSAVFGALHATGRKSANGVDEILNGISDGSPSDNFAGNNNDLAAGNVHTGPFASLFEDFSGDGDYQIKISGVLKGNAGAGADIGFSVTSTQIVLGGCQQ